MSDDHQPVFIASNIPPYTEWLHSQLATKEHAEQRVTLVLRSGLTITGQIMEVSSTAYSSPNATVSIAEEMGGQGRYHEDLWLALGEVIGCRWLHANE